MCLREPAFATACPKVHWCCSSHALMQCLPVRLRHCQGSRRALVTAAPASAQVFGNDSVLGRGNETAESAQQWQDDVDMPVSLCSEDTKLDPDLCLQLCNAASRLHWPLCRSQPAAPLHHFWFHVFQVGVPRQCLLCVCSLQRPSACPSTGPDLCCRLPPPRCGDVWSKHPCQPDACCVCAGRVSPAHC